MTKKKIAAYQFDFKTFVYKNGWKVWWWVLNSWEEGKCDVTRRLPA